MRVLVALAVAEHLGALVVGVAQVRRHLAADALAARRHVRARWPSAARLDFGRGGQVDDGLGQVELRLGQPDELDGLRRGVGDESAMGSAMPTSSLAQDHEPPGDEPGVLARLEHAGEPVERRRRDREPRMLLMNALITS